MAIYNYPPPRCPDYKKPKSVEECLPQARALVQKVDPSWQRGTIQVNPRFFVKEKDRVLIVSLPDQDKYVAEAITQAMMEQGVEKVNFIYPLELLGKEAPTYSVEDAYREAEMFKEGKASGSSADALTRLGLGEATRNYLDEHSEYTAVFLDVGGLNTTRALGNHVSKYRGFYPFNNWEWFLPPGHTFPPEIWDELERRAVESLGNASEVRITDPEGTYLEFSLTAEEAIRWQAQALVRGHLFMNPLMATAGELREVKGYSLATPPVFPRLNGVLAGTSNHCGFFPRMETYFEQDRLVEVKGGGIYGDRIRELMDRYKDIQWPGYPEKGLFWFCDTALCTAVGVHRRKSDMFNSYWIQTNMPERTRAGVFHHGFGSRAYRGEREFGEYVRKHNLPRGHIHGGHNYFSTFEIKLRGTEHWYKIVDKGWMTVLSDPDIRAMAANYGDPDELLNYNWIPPLPGINCEGDYLKDYAPDPVAYLRKRLEENKPI